MSVTLDRNNIEKITKQAKALGAEFLRQYRAEFLRQDSVATALDIAHEKARQYLQYSLPARPGAF
jgi:hypothetical protein